MILTIKKAKQNYSVDLLADLISTTLFDEGNESTFLRNSEFEFNDAVVSVTGDFYGNFDYCKATYDTPPHFDLQSVSSDLIQVTVSYNDEQTTELSKQELIQLENIINKK